MDTQLIKQSFALMKPHADRIVKRAYSKLETAHPNIFAMFSQADMTRQYTALIRALAFVTYNIEDRERTMEFLHELGNRHRAYGVPPEYYRPFVDTLLDSMRDSLGPAFDGKMRDVWVEIMGIITAAMTGVDHEPVSFQQQPSLESGQTGRTGPGSPEPEDPKPAMRSPALEPITEEDKAMIQKAQNMHLQEWKLPENVQEEIQRRAKAFFEAAIEQAWKDALRLEVAEFLAEPSVPPAFKKAQ
jgi:hemoglobin-like flavoprotein